MSGEGMRYRTSLALTLLAAAMSSAMAQTGNGDPTDIIAAQIRAQGYQCDTPGEATQDMQLSRPDEAVWTIQCETATYRVRLDPDMATKVERVGNGEDQNKAVQSGKNPQ